jgi:hypothetical protein
MAIWYILCSICHIFDGFGIMYQEKSGNPAYTTWQRCHVGMFTDISSTDDLAQLNSSPNNQSIVKSKESNLTVNRWS